MKTLEQKLVNQVLLNQRLNILENWDFKKFRKMERKTITIKTIHRVNNRPVLAPGVSKEDLSMGLRYF